MIDAIPNRRRARYPQYFQRSDLTMKYTCPIHSDVILYDDDKEKLSTKKDRQSSSFGRRLVAGAAVVTGGLGVWLGHVAASLPEESWPRECPKCEKWYLTNECKQKP